jgi:hypothetical protein
VNADEIMASLDKARRQQQAKAERDREREAAEAPVYSARDIAEARVEGAEAVLTALFESYDKGYSFGRVVERFKELVNVEGAEAVRSRLQSAGGLTVNNAIFSQVEAEGRA